jgi:sn-glycerol 3-phosphate transport system ATP-binding protein
VRKPQVFLFDEPLSNLDAKLRTQMRVEIKRLQSQLAVTSLYVTHDQVEAMTLADRIMVMNAGVAEQVGTPLEVYRRPASTFVAGFIGAPAMNFMPGRMGADGRSVGVDGGLSFALAEGAAAAGRPVTLGVRPEHLHPANEIPDATPIALRVELVEALGADTVVHGRIEGTSGPILARLPGTARVAIGDVLPLAPAPGELHLFDAETGRRMAA